MKKVWIAVAHHVDHESITIAAESSEVAADAILGVVAEYYADGQSEDGEDINDFDVEAFCDEWTYDAPIELPILKRKDIE